MHFCVVLVCIVFSYIVLYYIVLCWSVLNLSVYYCNILHCVCKLHNWSLCCPVVSLEMLAFLIVLAR